MDKLILAELLVDTQLDLSLYLRNYELGLLYACVKATAFMSLVLQGFNVHRCRNVIGYFVCLVDLLTDLI